MMVQPSSFAAWRAVALLSALYCISFIDRLILGMLIVPLKAELVLSDTQIGVLFGLSFALMYCLAGLPLARFADRGNRRNLIVIGVLVWTASTIASAFAYDHASLLACRAGVAVGEAVLTPTAISLIADLFTRDKRAWPTSLYTALGVLTAMGAFVPGGIAFDLATHLSPHVGGMAPWRLTLVLVGIPGMLLGLAFWIWVREPPREAGATTTRGDSLGEVARHVMHHWQVYLGVFAGVGLSATVTYALLGWTPTLLTRQFGLGTAAAGYLAGGAGAFGGLLGILTMPWVAGRLDRGGAGDGIFRAGIAFALLAMVFLMVAMTSHRLEVVAVGLGLALFGLSGLTLIPPLSVQQITPGRQRAQVMAVYLLITNLLGLGLGPVLAGMLTDHVFSGPGSNSAALFTLSVTALPAGVLLLILARKPFLKARAAAIANA
jgi:MFS family permease